MARDTAFLRSQRGKREGFLARLQPFAVATGPVAVGSRLPASCRLSGAGCFGFIRLLWVYPTARPCFWWCGRSRAGEHRNRHTETSRRLSAGAEIPVSGAEGPVSAAARSGSLPRRTPQSLERQPKASGIAGWRQRQGPGTAASLRFPECVARRRCFCRRCHARCDRWQSGRWFLTAWW